MNELRNRAIAHITDQMMATPNDYMIRTLEEYLTSICTTDAVAEKLLVEGKTLHVFIKSLWNMAQKRQIQNCAAMTSDEIIPMLEEYYEIVQEDKQETKSHKSVAPVIDFSEFL